MTPASSKLAQQRILAWVTLGILLAITTYAAFRIAGPYIEALLAGAALATLFHPLYDLFRNRLHRDQPAAFLSTSLLVVAVVVPMTLLIATVVGEIHRFFDALEAGTLDSSQYWAILDSLSVRIGMEPGQAEQMVRGRLQQLSGEAVQRTVIAAGAATNGFLQLVVMIGAFHMTLLRGAWLHSETVLHSPLGPQRTNTLLGTIRNMIRAAFYGVVAVATVQGTLLGIAAWIAGLPIPALWGLATAACSVLPLFGSALVWIPGTLLLWAKGNTAMAIFFLIWGALVVANSDNIVRPLVVMNSLQQVNGLLVFIAILGGIQAFGFTGVLAGPVTLAVGIALLRMLREELHNPDA